MVIIEILDRVCATIIVIDRIEKRMSLPKAEVWWLVIIFCLHWKMKFGQCIMSDMFLSIGSNQIYLFSTIRSVHFFPFFFSITSLEKNIYHLEHDVFLSFRNSWLGG